MLEFLKTKFDPLRFDSLVDAETKFKGDIEFEGTVMVKGTVLGSIYPHSDKTNNSPPAGVIVDSGGIVIGKKIEADHVVINGEVSADIIAAHLALGPKARVTGSISYRSLKVADGAILDGKTTRIADPTTVPTPAVNTTQQ